MNGQNSVSVQIAEQYVKAFGNLAKTGNTVLLPTNTGDISSIVSQESHSEEQIRGAMSIYTNLSSDRQRYASIESSEALEENITDSKQPSEHSNVGYDKNNDFTQIHFPELDTTRTSRRRTRTVVPEGMDSLTDLK